MIERTTYEIRNEDIVGTNDISIDSVWVLKSEHEQEILRIKKEIFDEQLKIAKACATADFNENNINFSMKYFMELLVRPSFGDDDKYYDKILGVFGGERQ